jgi:hypothetical protein
VPLQPNGGKLLMPVESEKDVQTLFEKALELSQTAGRFTKPHYHADIRDHFYYIGALCPQYFRPLQSEVINLSGELLSFMGFDFFICLYLFQDAPDSCVDRLVQRLMDAEQDRPSYLLEHMLAAIGTPAALAAIAEYAERTEKQSEFSRMGFPFLSSLKNQQVL